MSKFYGRNLTETAQQNSCPGGFDYAAILKKLGPPIRPPGGWPSGPLDQYKEPTPAPVQKVKTRFVRHRPLTLKVVTQKLLQTP